MRKVLATFLALFVAIAMSAQAAAPTPFELHKAHQAITAPTIDGTINTAEWATDPLVMTAATMTAYGSSVRNNLSDWELGSAGTASANMGMTVYMMWDANNLYLAADVTDPNVVYLADSGGTPNLNDSDVVQLLFDTQSNGTSTSSDGVYIHDFAPGTASNHSVAG